MSGPILLDYEKIDIIIRENFPRCNGIEIMNLCHDAGLRCSHYAINQRIKELGLKDHKRIAEKNRVIKFVTENYGKMTFKEIAESLGTNISRVNYYVMRQGLNTNKPHKSAHHLNYKI